MNNNLNNKNYNEKNKNSENNEYSIVSIPGNENYKEEIEENQEELEKIKDQENNKLVFEIDDSDITEDEQFEDDEAEELRAIENENREVVFTGNKVKLNNQYKNNIVVEKINDNLENTNNNSEQIVGLNGEEFTLDDIEGDNIDINNILKKESVQIETEVYLDEEAKIYEDDFTYIKELENTLLSALPVNKQGLLYVQQRIEREVQKIIEVKNLGLINGERDKKNIQYDYKKPWIVPIVLDKHKIYSKLKEQYDEEELNNNTTEEAINTNVFFTDSQEDEKGIEKIYQVSQLTRIKQIEHEAIKIKNYIPFLQYVSELNDLTKPYVPKKDMSGGMQAEAKDVGFLIHYRENTFVLRYYDLDNIYWNTYTTLTDRFTYENVYDPNGRLISVKKDILLPAERMNIVGFMVLPNAGQNMLKDAFTPSNYSHSLLPKYFKKVGDIQSITMSKDGNYIYIQVNNHGLGNGVNRIYIEGTNCFPSIDNTYHKSVEIYDDNIIAINVSKKKKIKDPSKESRMQILREGDSGVVYALNTLEYDLYKIEKDQESMFTPYKKQFINSNYKDGQESLEHVKVYLFDELNIPSDKKDDFEKIVQMVAPTLDDIVNMEYKNLQLCETYEEMKNVLKPYGIELSSLKDEQTKILIKILEEQLRIKEKYIEEESNIKSNLIFHEKNKQYFANPNIFLADMYINSPFIQKYYGRYLSFNKPQDSILGRLHWVTNQIDQGGLYYLYVLYENLDKFEKTYNLKDIAIKQKNININYEELEKTLKKEIQINKNKKNKCKLYTYDALKIEKGQKVKDFDETSLKVEENDKIIYYLYNGNVFYMDDKFYKVDNGKKIEINNEEVQLGTMALVGDKIYIFNKDKGWEESDMIPRYHEIRYLCEFGDLDLKEIDLDSLDCIYREQKGCDTRLVARLKDRIEFLDDINADYEELENYVKEEKYRGFIEYTIERILYKYFSKEIESLDNEIEKTEKNYQNKSNENNNSNNKNNKKENSKNKNKDEIVVNENVIEENKNKQNLIELKEEKSSSQVLTDFIQTINNLSNNDLQKNIIYELIDKDGILIGKDVYSKKFKCKMVCGHYHYENRIFKSTNVDKRDVIYNDLVSVFGDAGDADSKAYTCTNCGQELLLLDFDEIEGYSSSGAYILSRSVLEKDEMEEVKTDDEKMYYVDCDDIDFEQMLLKEGFTLDQSGRMSRYCDFVINNLCKKTGVKITVHNLVDILRDSINAIHKIRSKEYFKESQIQKYMEDKMPRQFIESLKIKDESGKDELDKMYEKYRELNVRCIITARFLICVQTTIPIYERNSAGAIGGFISFDGEDGFNYLSNILENLRVENTSSVVSFNGREHTKEKENIEKFLKKSYDDFKKNYISINDLFRKKNEYLREIKKKKTLVLDGDEPEILKKVVYPEFPPLSSDFKKELINSKNDNSFDEKARKLIGRMYFVGQEIMKIVQETIESRDSQETSFVLPEGSCCEESLDGYQDYYTFIQINYPQREKAESVYQYIEEAKELFVLYNQLIILVGSFSIFRLKNAEFFNRDINPIVVPNPDHTTQSIIQEMFENYVDEGSYKGTLREYVGIGMDAKDVKTGKTKKEILSKEYSIQEYKKLLKNIEELTKKIPVKVDEEKIQKDKMILIELKTQAQNNISKNINDLVEIIAVVLNKKGDEQFKTKYKELFRNMGYFSKLRLFDNEGDKPEQPISEQQARRYKIRNKLYRDEYRLNYLKKVYNLYFRYYLSFVQNKMSIQTLVDKVNEKIVGSKVQMEDIQKDITQNFLFLEKYIESSNNDFLQDLFFEHDANQINNIQGTNDKYINNFSEIVYSDFNMENACLVVLNLLVLELNRFIICRTDPTQMTELTSRKCQIVCEFILDILNLVENDTKMYNGCDEAIQRFKDAMLIHYLKEKAKKMQEVEEGEDNQLQRILNINSTKSGAGTILTSVDDVSEQLDKEQLDVDETLKMQEKEDNENEFAASHLKDKLGRDPTQAEIDKFKEEMDLGNEKLDSEETIGVVVDDEFEDYQEHLGDIGVGDIEPE